MAVSGPASGGRWAAGLLGWAGGPLNSKVLGCLGWGYQDWAGWAGLGWAGGWAGSSGMLGLLGNTAGGIERGTLEYRHLTYTWPSQSCFN